MNRWLALAAAVAGGAIGAFVGGSAAMVALYGTLWMFVFGDDSWPDWVMPTLDIAYPLLCFALWAVFTWLIWARLAPRRRAG